MPAVLTPDQKALAESTQRFLDDWSLQDLRDRPEAATVFDNSWWAQAALLGWTSFLVPESRGGGSVSGSGLADATLIARELGARVARGPFASAAVAAAALADDERHDDLLGQVLAGEVLVACATAEPGRWSGEEVGTTITGHGEQLTLNGVKEAVEAGDQADVLLVSAGGADGPQQVLVPANADGIHLTPMHSLDLSRRFVRVELRDVRVDRSAVVATPTGTAGALQRQLQIAAVLQCADTAGAVQHVFAMTRQYLDDRSSFGRPLASYQALKHRMADLKVTVEAIEATVDAAADAVEAGASDAARLVSVAKAFVGSRAPGLVQDCVQLHGGIGLTWEHDLHLYLRRVTQNSLLLGTPGEHRRALATLLGM